MATNNPLQTERAYFDAKLPEWMTQYAGQWLLIKGEQLIGAFPTVDEALAEGARRFGRDAFLVRQVQATPTEVRVPALTLGIL
jgi:hypothetical protein